MPAANMDNGPPISGLWRGCNIRANRQTWPMPDDKLPRPGSRRTVNTINSKRTYLLPALFEYRDSTDATNTAALFAAGDIISSSNDSSATGAATGQTYCLKDKLHHGPRSTVWKATRTADGAPVVVKVLPVTTPQQAVAAQQELAITQQVAAVAKQHQQQQQSSHAVVRAAGENAGWPNPAATQAAVVHQASSSKAAKPAGNLNPDAKPHLVQLLDSVLIKQHCQQAVKQPREHKAAASAAASEAVIVRPRGPSSSEKDDKPQLPRQQEAQESCAGLAKDAGLAARSGSNNSSDGECTAVVLVLEPLHQSLSWVLHHVRQRHVRLGLPPQAVRRIAHQLLSGLAELHDQHAVVHRDVKPSNLLLQQPFIGRKGRHLMRSMTLQELSTAQWSLIDLGSAAQLTPPTQPQPAAAAAAAAAAHTLDASDSGHSQHNIISGISISSRGGGGAEWSLVDAVSSLFSRLSGAGSSAAAAAAVSGRQHWRVAEGAPAPYETPAYTPPEALLHLPATSAYDVWSAACCLHEAATGRVLFPVEAAAAARGLRLPRYLQGSTAGSKPGTVNGSSAAATSAGAAGRGDAETPSSDDEGDVDQVHLKMIKGVCGPPPAQLLQQSPFASHLFADPMRGRLWIEEEEEQGEGRGGTALGFWGLKGRQNPGRASRPVLHQLMAAQSMPLQEAVELAGLLQPMLAWDPQQRPTALQLLQHPYFKPLLLESPLQQEASEAGSAKPRT